MSKKKKVVTIVIVVNVLLAALVALGCWVKKVEDELARLRRDIADRATKRDVELSNIWRVNEQLTELYNYVDDLKLNKEDRKPKEENKEERKRCSRCEYFMKDIDEDPCINCIDHDHFEIHELLKH